MEAMTADHLPIIGPSPNASGVFHSFGYSGHGFQLVPVLGAIMTDLIVHGGTNRVIEPFSAKRLIRKEVRHVAH